MAAHLQDLFISCGFVVETGLRDPVKAEAVLGDLMSGEAHRIWLACGAIRQSWDRPALRALAAREGDIRAAVRGVDLGGMLRPNASHLDFALQKLRFAAGEGCFCALYLEDDLFAPVREAEAGHVEISGEVVDHTAGATDYQCRCRSCGQGYGVHEETGYHYPWYVWTRVTVPG
ncbi:MAG: hypothetical protein ACRC6I_17315 [Paracoccaceae bacterium]